MGTDNLNIFLLQQNIFEVKGFQPLGQGIHFFSQLFMHQSWKALQSLFTIVLSDVAFSL